MPLKRAIHIGVNAVDPACYPKPPGDLRAPEADARAMLELTIAAGFDATLLVGASATRDRVTAELQRAAQELRAGDLLVLSFSGHGATFADTADAEAVQRPLGAINRLPGDEPFDQSWCLRDGVLIDDDLHLLLCDFCDDVWIYVLSDSCYSGTILRLDDDAPLVADPPAEDLLRGGADDPPVKRDVTACVLLSAASSDTELTYTTIERGVFTKAVLDTWDGGRFHGNYRDFHAAIRARSAAGQAPALGHYGRRSEDFEASRPFGSDDAPDQGDPGSDGSSVASRSASA